MPERISGNSMLTTAAEFGTLGGYDAAVRKVKRIWLGVALCAVCAAQERDEKPDAKTGARGFVAVFANKRVDARLEMKAPPDFTLHITYKLPDGHESQTFSTVPVKGKRAYRVELVRTRELDQGEIRAVAREYSTGGPNSWKVIISTEIKSISRAYLDHMYIDRPPFCLVQIINPAGDFPLPLNRLGAPVSERFQAAGPVPFRKGKKTGYMDRSRDKVLIEPRFDGGDRFYSGRARVELDGKTGYIDETGKLVIPAQFESGGRFGFHRAPELAAIWKDGKCGMIDRSGKIVIEPKYDNFGEFLVGSIEVHVGERVGLVSRTGKVLIEPKYDDVYYFSEGLACVVLDGKFGFVGEAGKLVIEARFTGAGAFGSGLAPVEIDHRAWGFIDRTGALKLPAIYKGALSFSEGLAGVAISKVLPGRDRPHLRWGMIDTRGKLVIPYLYESLRTFAGGRCPATLDGKVGWLSKDGIFTKRER